MTVYVEIYYSSLILSDIQGLEDNVSSVRDAFAEALGALLALAMNPDAQVFSFI